MQETIASISDRYVERSAALDPIGRQVRLNGHRFTVVGVFEMKGNIFANLIKNFMVIPHSAAFKYLMATVIASAFFLLGTALLYSVTGMLNIDGLIDNIQASWVKLGPAGVVSSEPCSTSFQSKDAGRT